MIWMSYRKILMEVENNFFESRSDITPAFFIMEQFYQTFNLRIPSPVQKISCESDYVSNIYVKRDDLIHPIISGNKFRKLKYILIDFFNSKKSKIIAFGGQYSNLLHALSEITLQLKIDAHFYIMSHGNQVINPTLEFIKKNGVKITYLSKSEFRSIRNPDYLNQLKENNPEAYIIPEGASNFLATIGSGEIIAELKDQFPEFPDYIIMDMGTGGTFAGVLSQLPANTKLIGIPILKGVDWKKTLNNIYIDQVDYSKKNYEIIEDYHFGGFAKWNIELIKFINNYKFKNEIPLDPIYTGKLVFAVYDLLNNGFFSQNSKILWIHGGGLQGIEGFNLLYNDLINV